MSTKTGISWTDATWNPIRGCSRVSEGCRHCYAERVAYRFSGEGQPYEGLVRVGADGARKPEWNGQIKFVEEHLLDPLRWKKPRRIFVNSMSDLFHENVTDEMRDKIFAVMALCPQHTFQVLTKRPERMLEYFNQGEARRRRTIKIIVEIFEGMDRGIASGRAAMRRVVARSNRPTPALMNVLPNLQLGVSVEDQKTAELRIPLLLQTPAAIRFISAEPLLEKVSFRWAKWDDWTPHPRRVKQLPPVFRDGRMKAGCIDEHDGLRMLDWIIVGGESGPGARPMHPDWARSLRDQCRDAGVPFFFKQWGEWAPARLQHIQGAVNHTGGRYHFERDPSDKFESKRVGTKLAGCLLDGVEHHEFPAVRA